MAAISYLHSVVIVVGWGYVSVELWLLMGLLSVPLIIYEWMWSSSRMIPMGENWRTLRETCPSTTFPVTNPIRLSLAQTWPAVVWIQQLAPWAMAQSFMYFLKKRENSFTSCIGTQNIKVLQWVVIMFAPPSEVDVSALLLFLTVGNDEY